MPSLAVRPHRVAMVEKTHRARLMLRFRLTPPLELTALTAVDLSSVVELTEITDSPAAAAPNLDQNLDAIHPRTATVALMELAPPVRLRAPSPAQRPLA